jgi:hypothetical protein
MSLVTYSIPEGAGQRGLTYCAPIAYKCQGVSQQSEQNWYVAIIYIVFKPPLMCLYRQGISHTILRFQILKQLRAQWKKNGVASPLQPDTVVQFGLILTYKPNSYAAAVRFYDYKKDRRDSKSVGKRSIERDFPKNLVGVILISPRWGHS